METIDKCFILKQNNEEIRKSIEGAGIHVCHCASFTDSCWLDYHTTVGGVHGVGYWGEENETHSQEEELARFMAETKNQVVCEDVDDFINHIKEFENGKTE